MMNLGYTGKPYDTATGLYNYGFRDYSPQAARFTTLDPVRDGNNWFAYVNNDPVNWIDPWGLNTSDAQSGFGTIDSPYDSYRKQDERWVDKPLGSTTIGEEGCKVTGASQIVSTITGKDVTPVQMARYADEKGNLTQDSIVRAITDNGGTVIPDHWEKQLNAQTLSNIKNGEGTTYVFGKAYLGVYGEHWVVITDYSVDKDGTITYTYNETSIYDTGRTFTSGSNNNDSNIGTVVRIETYTVR
jgi:RHS repeat-associated protein